MKLPHDYTAPMFIAYYSQPLTSGHYSRYSYNYIPKISGLLITCQPYPQTVKDVILTLASFDIYSPCLCVQHLANFTVIGLP